MSGSTHGDRKLRSPAVNETASPNDAAVPSIGAPGPPSGDGAGAPAAPDFVERRRRRRAGPLVQWFYALKYRAFRGERRARDGRPGLIMLQIDALSYADLRRALDLGYCPTIARLVADGGHSLRRWFCGLPSATPTARPGSSTARTTGSRRSASTTRRSGAW
jgi:hypothetical protein